MLTKGIQRNYWEGGLNGEGFIRIVKPLVKRGISQTGIFYSTMKQIYCLREINNLIENEDMLEEYDYSIDVEDNPEEIFDTERYRRFHCYRSREDIVHCTEEHKPIAIFFQTNI